MAKEGSQKAPQLADTVADSSDEEIDEDMAFNSEDERMYGDMFKRQSGKSEQSKQKAAESESDESSVASDDDNVSDEDSDDGIASDDDDENGDGGQYMLDLLSNLDKKSNDDQREKRDLRASMAQTSMIPESEFSSAALKSSSLTLDQLMTGITDTKGFKDVKNAMKDMTSEIYENDHSSSLHTTKVPVAKVVSERAERKVHYDEQKKDITGWTTTVKQNREAETLDFRPKERINMSKSELVQKFEPSTEFEREIAAALENAGAADEKEIMRREEEAVLGNEGDGEIDDDLGMNKLSPEEYKKRLGELQKMRALMFYEEQKRHHINKIKSKKYRKIRKKKRLRNKEEEEQTAAENDEELARELEEKNELERMKERMSLKHRNTSKWAKRVLRRGGNIDTETRKALSEQIRIGDELKKKMEGQYGDSDDDDQNDGNLLLQAQNILAETEKDGGNQKNKGIFNLAFMKNGIEAQRKRAAEEARELLKELEGNETGDSDVDNSDDKDDKSKNPNKNMKASKKEMEKILGEGKLVASSLEFGNSSSVQVSDNIDIEMKEKPSVDVVPTGKSSTTVSLKTPSVDEVEANTNKNVGGTNISRGSADITQESITEESNPWLIQGTNDDKKTEQSSSSKKRKKKSGPSVSKQGIINVADATNIISGEDSNIAIDNKVTTKSNDSDDPNSKITNMTQEELVRKAFAAPSEKEIEQEFEKEKKSMRERDDYSKKKKETVVSGWGSWTGDGAPVPRPPKKIPKKYAPPEKKIKRRKRDDDGKKNVIINAKRIKKTAKYQLEDIPHPYSSREQYERAMVGAVGNEWNVTTAVKNMTRPEVITRAGKMIRPISKAAKVKRTVK